MPKDNDPKGETMNNETAKELAQLMNDYESGAETLDTVLEEVNFLEQYAVSDERGELALIVEDFANRNCLRMFYDSKDGEYFTL